MVWTDPHSPCSSWNLRRCSSALFHWWGIVPKVHTHRTLFSSSTEMIAVYLDRVPGSRLPVFLLLETAMSVVPRPRRISGYQVARAGRVYGAWPQPARLRCGLGGGAVSRLGRYRVDGLLGVSAALTWRACLFRAKT